MNYNPNPKADFAASADNVKNHHALVENSILRRHLEVALAEMQHRSANGTNPENFNSCAASHLRMLGAKDFLAIFMNLAEIETPTVRRDDSNLPGNVRSLVQPKKN